MIGIARGLTYLHSKKIIHRGVKSSHIFLDKDFNAKLGGFGLVKYCRERSLNTRVMGTIGYAAPEYLSTGHLSTKCDIYSFGVVLLESMSGRRALDRNLAYGKQNLVDWASKVNLNRRNVRK
ncbi:putative transferase, protein kinase RLK-Pelle-RLCK-VIIa-2 family [Helianthus annuus]|nr:putative transferase, protein kinase RLK-Pelle-RLCK-VIIa-2 family [Helianthus annuus]